MLPPKKGNETNTPLAIGGERESPEGIEGLTGAIQRVFDIEKGFNFAQLSVKAKLASIQRTPQKATNEWVKMFRFGVQHLNDTLETL